MINTMFAKVVCVYIYVCVCVCVYERERLTLILVWKMAHFLTVLLYWPYHWHFPQTWYNL